MKPENKPITYEAFQAEVQRRKSKVWVNMLAAEPTERGCGKRPRDLLKEELLLRLDKARLARECSIFPKPREES